MVGHREDAVSDEWLAAAGADHLVRIHVDLAGSRVVIGHRLAQLRDAGRRGVAVHALGDRADAGQADVLRRGKVGLSDAEGDDVLALADELVYLAEDHERVLRAQLTGSSG